MHGDRRLYDTSGQLVKCMAHQNAALSR
jgi:hypothetical protein